MNGFKRRTELKKDKIRTAALELFFVRTVQIKPV